MRPQSLQSRIESIHRIDAFAVSMGAEPYAKPSQAAAQRRIEAQQRQ